MFIASQTQLWHIPSIASIFLTSVEHSIYSTMRFIASIDIHPYTDIKIHVKTQSRTVRRNLQLHAWAMTNPLASLIRVATDLHCLTTSHHESHMQGWLSAGFGNSGIRNSDEPSDVHRIHSNETRSKSVARAAQPPFSPLLRLGVILSSLRSSFLHRSCFFIIVVVALGILPNPSLASAVQVRPRSTEECIPATWQDVFVFILVNYVTHAMTVSSLPGESVAASAFYNLVALLLPFTGAWRGIRAIKSAARFGEGKMQHAARAGALCVVARSMDWRPDGGEKIYGCTVEGPIPIDCTQKARLVVQGYQDCLMDPIKPTEVRIHGQCSLPQGYCLVRLPADVSVSTEGHEPVDVASSQATAKVILSLTQLGFACATLYRARGSQLQQYGYAAFSLTVMPYAIMSFINLTGNLVMPNYPAIYMVRSEVMEEAKTRGGRI